MIHIDQVEPKDIPQFNNPMLRLHKIRNELNICKIGRRKQVAIKVRDDYFKGLIDLPSAKGSITDIIVEYLRNNDTSDYTTKYDSAIKSYKDQIKVIADEYPEYFI